MIGNDEFCPDTGAKISDETYYDEHGQQRVALADAFGIDGENEGELTKGAICSSKVALFNHFRRCHQKHEDENKELYRKAAIALSRLKRAAEGSQHDDIYIWYTLQYRLSNRGFSVDWMHTHAALRCPRCHSQLKYEKTTTEDVVGYCGSNCTSTNENQLCQIRKMIAELYTHAFDDAITPEQILQFPE